MIKRTIALLAALAMVAGASLAGGSPVYASVGGIVWEQATVDHLRAQGFAVHTPAEWAALKSYNDCPPQPPASPNEYLCLWNGYSFTGSHWEIPSSWLQDTNGTNAINGLSLYGSGINDASKGWANNTYYKVYLYDNSSCQLSGWYRTLDAGNYAVQSSAASADWENRISSLSTAGDAGTYCFSTPNT